MKIANPTPRQITVLLAIALADPVPVIMSGAINGWLLPHPTWSHSATIRALLRAELIERHWLQSRPDESNEEYVELYALTQRGRETATKWSLGFRRIT